jgi:hypothetical protein
MKSTRHSTSDLSRARWRSSTYSGGNNECVEIADIPLVVPVRDSKSPTGPVITFSRNAWDVFLGDLCVSARSTRHEA